MIEFNVFIYGLLFFFYFFKDRRSSISILLLGIYFLAAIFSVYLFHHPDYDNRSITLKLGPFIYLFICLYIFFNPLLRFKIENVVEIKKPPIKIIYIISFVIIVLSALTCMLLFPYAVKGMIGDLAQNRINVRENGLEEISGSIIYSAIVTLGLSINDFSILLFFYLITFYRSKRTLNILLGFFVILTPLLYAFSYTARGSLIFIFLKVLICFLLFRKFMTIRTIKLFKYFFVISSIMPLIFTIIITNSRFGDSDMNPYFSVFQYLGESFIQFNGVLFDNIKDFLYGDRILPIFRKIIGINLITVDQQMNITGIKPYIFYTFVGDFIMDFGHILTFILILILSRIMRKSINYSKIIHFHDLILFYLFYLIAIQGVFCYMYIGYLGNFIIIITFLIYFYFRINASKILFKRNKFK